MQWSMKSSWFARLCEQHRYWSYCCCEGKGHDGVPVVFRIEQGNSERNWKAQENNWVKRIYICSTKKQKSCDKCFRNCWWRKAFYSGKYKEKDKKLPQYRETFRSLGLAIILHEIPTTYAEQHIPEWISEVLVEMECSYDFVYVISHRFCIYYNVHQNSLSEHTLSNEESTSLIMTAEGELTLSNVEWL